MKNNPHVEFLEEINLKAAFWTFPLLVERKNDLLLHLQKNGINASSVHIRMICILVFIQINDH